MRARDLADRFGEEFRVARRAAGLSQREVAGRSRISQSVISRVERGVRGADLATLGRLCSAVGHDLSIRLYPADGVRLHDSGHLAIADLIRESAHRSWRVRLEVPVAPPPDRRAADMVLEGLHGALHIEIERRLADVQAQLRAAQLKRVALAERLRRSVTLILAIPDTSAAREVVRSHRTLLQVAMPMTSRAAWAAIRSGEAPGGDAILWVRRR